jgi:hypothetical protein
MSAVHSRSARVQVELPVDHQAVAAAGRYPGCQPGVVVDLEALAGGHGQEQVLMVPQLLRGVVESPGHRHLRPGAAACDGAVKGGIVGAGPLATGGEDYQDAG